MLNKKVMLLAIGVVFLVVGLLGKPYLNVSVTSGGIELSHKLD